MTERHRIGPRRNNRGGIRSKAGRKPGPVDLTVAVHPTGGGVAEMNAARQKSGELTPPQRVAITLYVRGVSKLQIAGKLNRDWKTISKWIEANPEAVAEEVRKYSATDYFLPHVPRAVQTTVEVMENASHKPGLWLPRRY